MASYKIVFARSVKEDFKNVPKTDARRILSHIQELADDPRPPGSKKLTNDHAWRIRIGNYRVLYDIFDDTLLILILKVGNRKDVYKK